MRRPLPYAIACVVIAFSLVAGCDPVTPRVERAIERELPRAIGPADSYTVTIEGLRARAGEARLVTVTGERVRPDDAPVLERLELELRGVRFDRRTERLTRVKSGQAAVRVKPGDLASFLETHRNVREASVVFTEPDRAALRLRPTFAGFVLPSGVAAEVHGRLLVQDGRLHFAASEVSAAGALLGAAAARRLSDMINPLVDMEDGQVRLRVTQVAVRDGSVHLTAAVDAEGMVAR